MSQQSSVLVVSDKKLVRSTLGSILGKAGVTDVRYAESAEDALAMLEMKQADVIITEWMMPQMDGIELTRHVKLRDRDMGRYTAVLLYSACDDAGEIVRAYDAGIHDFIGKPVHASILAARVGAALRVCHLYSRGQRDAAAAPLPLSVVSDQSLVQDPETGLWNTQYLNNQLSGMLENSRSRDLLTTCAVIGIDEFTRMTNSYGKPAGLELVTGLADRIKSNLRPLDVVARVRSNSLAIALQSNNTTFNQRSLFQRIIKSISRQSIRTSAGNIAITISVGVASVSMGSQSLNADQLLEMCWEKMVEATANGGNRMVA